MTPESSGGSISHRPFPCCLAEVFALSSLPGGYRGQGRHRSLNGSFETPPVPVLSGRSTQPFLRCQVATEGRVATESLNGSFGTPPVPVLSGRSIRPFFTARWLQRAGSPLVPERLLRDAACTRTVWQKNSPFLRCQVATEGRVATCP